MDILNIFGFSKKCEKLESTIDCFKLTNWECPNELEIQIYEISICDYCYLGRASPARRIKEIFIPYYNISINKADNFYNNFNIILDSQYRYVKKDDSRGYMKGWEMPKLLQKITLDSEQTHKIFNLIYNYVKKDKIIKEMFSDLI